jgi:hypothetical protein
VENNRQRQRQRDQKRRLRHLVRNNLAFDLKRSSSEVWLLGQCDSQCRACVNASFRTAARRNPASASLWSTTGISLPRGFQSRRNQRTDQLMYASNAGGRNQTTVR